MKPAAVAVLKCLPPLPKCVLDCYVSRCVGNKPPTEPEVLYISLLDDTEVAERLPLEELPAQVGKTVRLVIISDTHERHRQVSVPVGDVLVHCGDILMASSLAVQSRGERVLRDFNEWLATVPCQEKVVIGGNHDSALLRLGTGAAAIITNAVLLDDTAVSLLASGLKIYGNSHSEGATHNRAWQAAPTVSDACADADIVLSHECSERLRHEVLPRCRPTVWASGHHHDRHGIGFSDGTLFANAAIMDKKHNPVQPPIVVDLVPKMGLQPMAAE